MSADAPFGRSSGLSCTPLITLLLFEGRSEDTKNVFAIRVPHGCRMARTLCARWAIHMNAKVIVENSPYRP